MRSFPLAPMDGLIRATTIVALPLPLIFPILATLPMPFPQLRWVMWGVFAFLALMWLGIWTLMRPTRFEVSHAGLRIVWPMRERMITRHQLESAEVLSNAEFRKRYGWGMRVGAGGLWGGFGMLVTPSQRFSLWISRIDPLVVVKLTDDKPLLITPAEPERFVAELALVLAQA
ncbi:MAG: hypothetical protein JST54_14860 [Deltaproteobacteria bacterium]|nr:hypothetical protein [Deltaproteobacteria bacterium]